MSSPLAKSFGRELADLEAYMRAEFQVGTPEGNFAIHVYAVAGEAGPLPGWGSPAPGDILRKGLAPQLAAAGFQMASLPAVSPEHAQGWEAGATRLSSRNAFPADQQTFAFRPLELYGIVLGAERLLSPDHAFRSWLKDVLGRLEREVDEDPLADLVCSACAKLLGCSWTNRRGGKRSEAGAAELALRRWLLATGTATDTATVGTLGEVDEQLLRVTALAPANPTHVARAALLHYALRSAVRERLESDIKATELVRRNTGDAVAVVAHLSRRFPLFARQLQVRHDKRQTLHFRDEYDVQDAMHALLKLHFDDVRAEEWTPSYAGTSSRIDFLLKPERVVVEVKMTRKSLNQKEVVNQLIQDKERYRAHPDCRTLVCFVYDPEGYCDNPTALEADVSKDEGDFRVVTIVSPKGT